LSIASNHNTPVYILEKIYNYDSFNENLIKKLLYFNENCPVSILKKIYKNNKNYKEKVIKHPNWKLKDFE